MDQKKDHPQAPEAKAAAKEAPTRKKGEQKKAASSRDELAAQAPQTNSVVRYAFVLSLLALVISMIILLERGISHTAWQQQALVQPEDLGQLSKLITSNQQQLTSHSEAIANLQTGQKQLANQLSNTDAMLKHLLKQRVSGDQNWQIDEAKHLVSLAQVTLSYSQNSDLALRMLKTADTRLTAANRPKAQQMLKSLINQLEQLPNVKVDSIVAGLNGLTQSLTLLPFKDAVNRASTEQKQMENSQQKASWRENLGSNLKTLRQLVVIRHHDEGVEPLLAPEQKQLLALNIGLYLQQAQWAALKHDQAIYHHSLKQVKSLVLRYFDDKASRTQTYLSELDNLAKQSVTLSLPDLTPRFAAISQELADNAQP